jgi:molecular chaperone DnaK (HSP70)
MANINIQIGIDLGTTNSEIAINNNGKIEIVKNNFRDEYTPSVFGFDKANNKVVGKKAYDCLYKDAFKEEFGNYKADVKRLMGTEATTTHFERANLNMTAEEISAEILKNMKNDILRKYPDFNTVAAVITTPAAFSILQAEATRRAGNLAGFEHVILLQEPIAAAMAHGFENTKDENWLIYDLGGGTFDVALVSSKDGILSVRGHRGDNFLGGKNIDLAIVDKFIIPKIVEKFSISNFNRGNETYENAFLKLKYIAETSKICLSQADKSLMDIEGIGMDDDGKKIDLPIDFYRQELEKIIKPFIDKTIELSKETLQEAGVENTSVKKIILIGGPTQIPYIKNRLETDLKIAVDSSMDPLTSVAYGACVFGISQKIPKEFLKVKTKKGSQSLVLYYETLTSDTEQMIAGSIETLKDADDEHYIQIQSDNNLYTGPKIKLKSGKFLDTVKLEPNKPNLYWIFLCDKDGNSIPVEPDSFTITHGLSVSGAPLPHTIGIVLADKGIKNNFTWMNTRENIFERGSILPLKFHGKYKTARKLKKSENENPLKIFIDEGEADNPNNNTYICEIEIKGEELPYDLPEGTLVEIDIEMNESREVSVTVDIPLIDRSFRDARTTKDKIINIKDLKTDLGVQTEKAKVISENCTLEEKKSIKNAVQSVKTSLASAHFNNEEKQKAHKEIRDLKISLDKIEKQKEMPQLIKEFHKGIKSGQEIIDDYTADKDKDMNNNQLSKIKSEGEKAIKDKDKILLRRTNNQLHELTTKVLFSNPDIWIYQFQKIVSENNNFTNEKEAEYYITKGEKAIKINDIDELKQCVHSLILLLPSDKQEEIKNDLSGITR